MEQFAQIFISTIALTNVLIPQAQVPQVLGVKIASDSVVQTTTLRNTESLTIEERLQEAKSKRIESQKMLREKVAEQSEARVAKREEFAQQLAELKDEKKQERLTKLNGKIEDANVRWTEHWMKVLDRLVSILARVQSRIDKLATNDVDVASVQILLDKAESDIVSAQEMVASQASNYYIVDLSNESGINQSAQEQFKLLKSDLSKVKEVVSQARTSVREVVVAVAQISEL